jgi:ubiquinone/menaquinone biosynthesis C-methylase UbiE
LLLERLVHYAPVSSVLELGSNCGPNLYRIAKAFPECSLVGVDANPLAVDWGNAQFRKEGLATVRLVCSRVDELEQFGTKSFDLVLTDALLIYIGPDKIEFVVREMLRIARKALILVEWHEDGSESRSGLGALYEGVWKRDYRRLIEESVRSTAAVHLSKVPVDVWPSRQWMDLGYVIEIRL